MPRGRPGPGSLQLSQIHLLTAQIALILALAIAVSSGVLALLRRAPGTFFGGGALWAGLIVALAGLVGIAVALGQGPPRDPLHIVYGILAVGAVPGTAIVAGGRVGRGRAVAWAIGGIVLLILVMRLFQTGG
jgi:hypothetical protein